MRTCYRHPDRETAVACSRCERPICPDCMTPTSVGMRCPDCSGDRTEVRTISSGGGAAGLAEQAPATTVLIAINVGIFVAQLAFGGGATSFDGGGALFREGALCGNAVGSGGLCGGGLSDGGEWWRVLSSGFLHGGFIHLALNMFVLYILGRLVEPAIGTSRFVAIYLVSLVGGSFGALLLTEPAVNTVGASGAIYGLFAATLLIARNRGLDQVVAQLGFWLLLNLVLTFSVPGISIGGHLGGMAAGAIAALVVLQGERRTFGSAGPGGMETALLAGLAVAFAAGSLLVAYSASGPGSL